jgi:hypothetical protein
LYNDPEKLCSYSDVEKPWRIFYRLPEMHTQEFLLIKYSMKGGFWVNRE